MLEKKRNSNMALCFSKNKHTFVVYFKILIIEIIKIIHHIDVFLFLRKVSIVLIRRNCATLGEIVKKQKKNKKPIMEF